MNKRHGMGRVPSPKDSRDYRLEAILRREPIPKKRLWYSDATILDQKDKPHCVGFGWAGWGRCKPVQTLYRNLDGDKIYYEAKLYDREPLIENGSTVRSGAKAMLARKRILAYYFAQTFYEALEFVGNHGPAVIGIEWYDGMYYPKNGIITPTGPFLGGHCVLWRGIEYDYAIIRNSWGRDWAYNGDCKILLTDLEMLLKRNGEACAAVEAPHPADKPSSMVDVVVDWFRR